MSAGVGEGVKVAEGLGEGVGLILCLEWGRGLRLDLKVVCGLGQGWCWRL